VLNARSDQEPGAGKLWTGLALNVSPWDMKFYLLWGIRFLKISSRFVGYVIFTAVYKAENTAVGFRHADHVAHFYPQKLAPTSPTSGGRSVGIVRSRTQATESSAFSF
jgi:hypothetical protein